MSRLRVGLVGARAARQGLGPFVARDLEAAGLEVSCFLGTSEATVREAGRQLREHSGVAARGYTRLGRMLDAEPLDALAILSPPETHEHFLREAVSAGLHVLCEKPLLWGGGALGRRALECVEEFRARGLLLAENCQWPFSLEAFHRLHPASRERAPARFRMWLTPTSRGFRQLGDCLPHALSLLQVLVPGDHHRVEKPTFQTDRGHARTSARFDYVSDTARVQASVELRTGGPQPRAAGFAIDDARADRIIQWPGYTMELSDGTRSVTLPDPLTARIASFARELRAVCAGGPVPSPTPLVTRMTLLDVLVEAWRRTVDEGAELSE